MKEKKKFNKVLMIFRVEATWNRG